MADEGLQEEGPGKRRLSLRLGGDRDAVLDKRPKADPQGRQSKSKEADAGSTIGEQGGQGGQGGQGRGRASPVASISHRSSSSRSPPGSSSTEGAGRMVRRSSRRSSFAPITTSSAPTHPSMGPGPAWRAGDQQATQMTPNTQSSSSSRSSTRPLRQNVPTNIPPSTRIPSPPLGFNLSTGQPLVNPPMKTQAAFVGKLYSMLEDDDILTTGLIHWSSEGTTFTCPNPTEFSKEVLPRFFKHNNWQSFVRQLNMYSFNKVNDLYATSSDPQAWEFRHPLFRRGEAHLLAQIKRKSARSSQVEGQTAASPTDETSEMPRAVAGWMRESGNTSVRTSPVRETPTRGPVYGHNLLTGETIQPRQQEETRPSSQSYWDARPPNTAMSTGRIPDPPPRFHPDPTRPPLTAQRYVPQYPESPYYPQPQQPSPVTTLNGQVAFLEDRVQRLSDLLNNERVDHVRTSIDFTSAMLNLINTLGNQPSVTADLRALHDSLTRQGADLRHKYETLMASDALTTLSGAGPQRPPTGDRRRTAPEPAPWGGGAPGPRPAPGVVMSDPRMAAAAHLTPRSSPLISNFPDPSGLPAPPAHYPSRMGGPSFGPTGPGHPPPFSTSPLTHTQRDIPRSEVPPPLQLPGLESKDVKFPSGHGHAPARAVAGEDEPMDDVKPKTGLQNLLN